MAADAASHTGAAALLRLPRRAPISHRLAHALAVRGWRGSLRLWRLVARVAPLPPSATLSVFGQPLPVDLTDVIGPYLYFGVYERWELEVLARVVRPGTACVDVGANEGLYTVAMRAAVGANGAVVAFEPQPWLADRLRRLVAATDGADVFVLPVALGAAEGSAPLSLVPGHSGLASLGTPPVPGGPSVGVPVTRLDAVEVVRRLGEIELLKVDVESFEAEVLAGAAEVLSAGRVRSALVEVSARHGEVAGALARLGDGYRFFRVGQHLRLGRYRARLEPLDLTRLADSASPFNLFACRHEVLPDLADLVEPELAGR